MPFFDPKIAFTVGTATPAARAISGIVTPAYPFFNRSWRAATRMASLVSSACLRRMPESYGRFFFDLVGILPVLLLILTV